MQQLRQVLKIMSRDFDNLYYETDLESFFEKVTKKGCTYFRLIPWHEMKQQYKPKKNRFMIVYTNSYVTIKPIPLEGDRPPLGKNEAGPIGIKIRNPTADRLRLSNRDWVKIRDSPTMVQFGEHVDDNTQYYVNKHYYDKHYYDKKTYTDNPE
jgi:hypothetical protein